MNMHMHPGMMRKGCAHHGIVKPPRRVELLVQVIMSIRDLAWCPAMGCCKQRRQ
tara:strand:- start:954 stop:1115 length:162 start_codon:yes stop_codon:yes gene_type:complete